MTYTIEYPTTGQRETVIVPVTNWYGKFATVEDAQAYLRRASIPHGKIVTYPAKPKK